MFLGFVVVPRFRECDYCVCFTHEEQEESRWWIDRPTDSLTARHWWWWRRWVSDCFLEWLLLDYSFFRAAGVRSRISRVCRRMWEAALRVIHSADRNRVYVFLYFRRFLDRVHFSAVWCNSCVVLIKHGRTRALSRDPGFQEFVDPCGKLLCAWFCRNRVSVLSLRRFLDRVDFSAVWLKSCLALIDHGSRRSHSRAVVVVVKELGVVRVCCVFDNGEKRAEVYETYA